MCASFASVEPRADSSCSDAVAPLLRMAAEEVAEFRARHGLEDDSDFAFFFGGYDEALAVSRDVATCWDACWTAQLRLLVQSAHPAFEMERSAGVRPASKTAVPVPQPSSVPKLKGKWPSSSGVLRQVDTRLNEVAEVDVVNMILLETQAFFPGHDKTDLDAWRQYIRRKRWLLERSRNLLR